MTISLQTGMTEMHKNSRSNFMKALLIGMAVSFFVQANDGFGELGVGGIVLEKTHDIAMQKEVLEIGYTKIKVDYEFINESSHDITTKVSFPLPTMPSFPSQSGVIYKGEPSDFKVLVNGSDAQFNTSVSAFINDQDVTPQLKSAGFTEPQLAAMPFDIEDKMIADNFNDDGTFNGVLTKKQAEELTRKGLMKELPLWNLQVTYHWTQKFPAGSTTKISHEYIPFTASGTQGGYTHKEFEYRKLFDRFCIDNAVVSKMDRLEAQKSKDDAYGQLSGTIVEYILLTANSWKDGIRDFTLRLRKENPDEIISLCFPGSFKKVDSTTLESHIKNFVPTENLSIYFANAFGSAQNLSDYGTRPR